ncbi:hypothetical protein LMH87_010356 [Akanthomyces muscarius]|uniref:Aimless RasGEF n=1 Tax=Akanthomyces muscarius TaxID=2231603 RepID=A0A9W8QGH8_AKAMU|nr:hypothetical protein LMH87_010356 [Akanthomyces muscarius]KAJ4153889.1 hypothetical protein LMH87_010356 [Akanthomyces muscarius]
MTERLGGPILGTRDATPLNSHSAGRRTSTPSAATDNLRPRRPLGPRRASSPGRGQPTPPPPSPPLSRPPASSSFYISDPISPRAANTGRRCPSAAAAAKSTTPTLPSAAASSATNTTSSAAAAAAPPVSAPPSSTLTTAYPATDNPGPDRVNRESVISILDDPFFLRYDYDPSSDAESPFSHLPSPPRAAADHQPGGDENGASPRWPPPRRESLTISPSPFLAHTVASMESYTIAVIGSAGAGKSTFIQKVLGLSRPPIGSSASVRLVVDNITQGVSLFELDLENFDQTASSQTMQWPKQINGHIVPRPDAALLLYDVTTPESVRPLPQAMTAITNAGLPSILVACKCEIDEDDWEVDADGIAGHKVFKSCIGAYKVSSDKPDISRGCLQAILKAAIAHRREQSETVPRRRAQSAVNLEAPENPAARPLSQQSKHSRASSELSALKGFGMQPSESYRARASKNSGQVYRTDKPGTDYYLDVEESDSEGQTYSDDIPILQRSEENFVERPPKITGVPLAELVDRLLAVKLSRADINFLDIFLCLYRKFTTPTELFSAILARLDRVRDDKTAHYLSKTGTQLRIIEVIAKWVSLYPGDFAKISTRRSLFEFIQHLSTEPVFSVASQQMRRSLRRSTLEDDDTGWATSDNSSTEADDQRLSKEMGELSASIGMVQVDEDGDGGPEPSAPLDFAGQPGGQVQFHSYDEYEREAASLEPADLHPMNKTRYHIFMDLSDDDIADELTRIDWILFSSIRIRDLVRYVSLSTTQKEKATSLKNVNRMINHFNHIAKWVANLILLRDKAKHRAQMLEKFMNIALKLRLLNNYNGLAAILAGINGTAIHRLAQTRQLVSPEVQKRFARAVVLMGTQKSHSAYRLAWENSPPPRIPFVPLHLRDLVNAEEGSKTFVGPNGERVNWRKFEVLGDVLLPLMKSQGTAYPNLVKNMLSRELILGCRMPTDDEEIYQRSIELESSNSTGVFDPAKKKFPWFAK